LQVRYEWYESISVEGLFLSASYKQLAPPSAHMRYRAFSQSCLKLSNEISGWFRIMRTQESVLSANLFPKFQSTINVVTKLNRIEIWNKKINGVYIYWIENSLILLLFVLEQEIVIENMKHLKEFRTIFVSLCLKTICDVFLELYNHLLYMLS
jgi:hypothetical protein